MLTRLVRVSNTVQHYFGHVTSYLLWKFLSGG